MVFTTQKLTNKCPSLHSLQEKKDWKFYELMGQGGQGWIQVVQAVLALARVAWVRWAFIFPPVKWGRGFSAASQPTVCSAAFRPREVCPLLVAAGFSLASCWPVFAYVGPDA